MQDEVPIINIGNIAISPTGGNNGTESPNMPKSKTKPASRNNSKSININGANTCPVSPNKKGCITLGDNKKDAADFDSQNLSESPKSMKSRG